ncbi:unnamed protein product, partial [Didymodactylos carnosus]
MGRYCPCGAVLLRASSVRRLGSPLFRDAEDDEVEGMDISFDSLPTNKSDKGSQTVAEIFEPTVYYITNELHDIISYHITRRQIIDNHTTTIARELMGGGMIRLCWSLMEHTFIY